MQWKENSAAGQPNSAGLHCPALDSGADKCQMRCLNCMVQRCRTSDESVARQEGRQRKQSFVCWGEEKRVRRHPRFEDSIFAFLGGSRPVKSMFQIRTPFSNHKAHLKGRQKSFNCHEYFASGNVEIENGAVRSRKRFGMLGMKI